MNLHSGEYAMYVPWDSKRELATDLPVRFTSLSPRIQSSPKKMSLPQKIVKGCSSYLHKLKHNLSCSHTHMSSNFTVFL